MKKTKGKLLLTLLITSYLLLLPATAQAQVTPTSSPLLDVEIEMIDNLEATDGADATTSTKLASPSAEVEQKIQEKKDKDLTETGGKQKSKLAAYLDENPIGRLSWNNPLQHIIRKAIEKGLPANIVVLLILFPLIASIIAASRHVIGLKGFGIYTPAVLSVAFVSTGILSGTIMFLAVLIAAVVTRKILRRAKLPYLPRTAMLLWGVSIFILLLLIISSIFDIASLSTLNIFPLLIIMLLSENFIETQLLTTQKEALKLTLETLFIAILCSLVINREVVQQFVIIKPELTFILIAIANYAIGKYSGLRLSEYIRFQRIIDKTS